MRTAGKKADPFCGNVFRKGSNQPVSCRLDKGHKGKCDDVRPSERAMAMSAIPERDDTAIGTVRGDAAGDRVCSVAGCTKPGEMQSGRCVDHAIQAVTGRPLPKVHRVKSWPEQFRAVVTGRKRFEMRRDDRDYQPGDTIELQEFRPEFAQLQLVKADTVPGNLTGRSWMGVIGYVSRGGPLPAGWCAFDLISVEDINRVEMVRR